MLSLLQKILWVRDLYRVRYAVVLQDGHQGDVSRQVAALACDDFSIDEQLQPFCPIVADELDGMSFIGADVAVSGEAQRTLLGLRSAKGSAAISSRYQVCAKPFVSPTANSGALC